MDNKLIIKKYTKPIDIWIKYSLTLYTELNTVPSYLVLWIKWHLLRTLKQTNSYKYTKTMPYYQSFNFLAVETSDKCRLDYRKKLQTFCCC